MLENRLISFQSVENFTKKCLIFIYLPNLFYFINYRIVVKNFLCIKK